MSLELLQRFPEALIALFPSALGSYKIPTSDRTVQIDDANEARGMLILAINLRHIVDARAALRACQRL